MRLYPDHPGRVPEPTVAFPLEKPRAIPLKVLRAVISKTIAWMAALIENNEGHIEHMVAVVSPRPRPLSQKLQSNLVSPCKICAQIKKKGDSEITVCRVFQVTHTEGHCPVSRDIVAP